MTRRSPAASPRLGRIVPSGYERTSTPARRAPIAFWARAADRDDAAVELDLAGRGDLVPVVDVAAEPSMTSSAKARPADGPPTSPRSMSTLIGELDVRPTEPSGCRSRRASVAGARSCGPCMLRGRLPAAQGELHLSARLQPRPAGRAGRRESGPRGPARRRSRPWAGARRRGGGGSMASTMTPSGLCLHVVAQLAQRHGSGDSSERAICWSAGAGGRCRPLPGARIASSGTRSAPSGGSGARLLEPRGPPHEHVDVVDAAGGLCALALDVHAVHERLRLVGGDQERR